MSPTNASDQIFRSPTERRWTRLAVLLAVLLAVGVIALAVSGVAFVIHSFTDTSIEDAARAQWEQQTGQAMPAGGGMKSFGDCAVVDLGGSGGGTFVMIKRHGEWTLAGKNADTATGYWDLDSVNSRDECRSHAESTFVATTP